MYGDQMRMQEGNKVQQDSLGQTITIPSNREM